MKGVGVLEAGRNGVGELTPPALPPKNIEAPLPNNMQLRLRALATASAAPIGERRP
jgi:hypothetical protein